MTHTGLSAIWRTVDICVNRDAMVGAQLRTLRPLIFT